MDDFLNLRFLTWIGMLTVAGALLYANLITLEMSGFERHATNGWPFYCRTEIMKRPTAPGRNRVHTTYDSEALGLNILVATIFVIATGLTLEQSRKHAGHWQFSLGFLFLMMTVVAMLFWLNRTTLAWPLQKLGDCFGSLRLRANQWAFVNGTARGDTPPALVRTIIHAGFVATLWQVARSIIWLVAFVVRRAISVAKMD